MDELRIRTDYSDHLYTHKSVENSLKKIKMRKIIPVIGK